MSAARSMADYARAWTWSVLCVLALAAGRAVGPAVGPGCAPEAAGPECRAAGPSPPAAGPQCLSTGCRYLRNSTDREHFYLVNNKSVIIEYAEGLWLHLRCPEGLAADDEALPRFARRVRVLSVTLSRCGPPRASLAGALAALGAAAPRLVLAAPPARPPLRATHFAALPVADLEIAAAAGAALRLDSELLANVTGLEALTLDGVRGVTPPPGLRALRLRDAGVSWLPAERLGRLEELRLEDDGFADAGNLSGEWAPRLRRLELRAPAGALPPMPALREATVHGAAGGGPWRACAALRNLTVGGVGLRPAAGWLERCTALRRLTVRGARLQPAAAGLLRGPVSLRVLRLQWCGLTALPPDLLQSAVDLTALDLSHNELSDLPAGLLAASARSLREVSLAYNRLGAAALGPLAAAQGLHVLGLDHNPLGDLCDHSSRYATSPLRALRELRELRLQRAGLTRVCADWLQGMPHLRLLDLRDNNVTELQHAELHALRAEPALAAIDLCGNPVSVVRYSYADYNESLYARARTVPAAHYTLHTTRILRFRRVRAEITTRVRSAAGAGGVRLAAAVRLRGVLVRAGAGGRARRRERGRRGVRGGRGAARAAAGLADVPAARRRRVALRGAARGGGRRARALRGGGRARAGGRPAARAARAAARAPRRARAGRAARGGGAARAAALAAHAGPVAQQPVGRDGGGGARAVRAGRPRAAGGQPVALPLRRARPAGRRAAAPRAGGGLGERDVRGRRVAAGAVRRRRAGVGAGRRRRQPRAGGRARRGGGAPAPRAPPQARAAAARARRAPLPRVRVLRARGRAAGGRAAGGAAGGGRAPVPRVRGLPRVARGRLAARPGGRLGARRALHAGGGVGGVRARRVGAGGVPRRRGRRRVRCAAARAGGAAAAGRAALTGRAARAQRVPARRALPALGGRAPLAQAAHRAARAHCAGRTTLHAHSRVETEQLGILLNLFSVLRSDRAASHNVKRE